MKRKLESSSTFVLPVRAKRTRTEDSNPNASTISANPTPIQPHTSTGEPATSFRFFDLPAEIRNTVYALCGEDHADALRSRSHLDHALANSWEIECLRAPALNCSTVSKRFGTKYTEEAYHNMQLIVRMSVSKQNLDRSAARWYDSLPVAIKDNVRTVRLVVHFWHHADGFSEGRVPASPQGVYAAFQQLMNDAAAALPSLHTLYVLRTFPAIESLKYDVDHVGVDFDRLLSIRPTLSTIPQVQFGLLVDTHHPGFLVNPKFLEQMTADYMADEPWRSEPKSEDDIEQDNFPFLDEVAERLREDGRVGPDWPYDYPDQRWDDDDDTQDLPPREVRWYVTLPTGRSDSTRQHLGLDWQIVGSLGPVDVGDDEEGESKWPGDRDDAVQTQFEDATATSDAEGSQDVALPGTDDAFPEPDDSEYSFGSNGDDHPESDNPEDLSCAEGDGTDTDTYDSDYYEYEHEWSDWELESSAYGSDSDYDHTEERALGTGSTDPDYPDKLRRAWRKMMEDGARKREARLASRSPAE